MSICTSLVSSVGRCASIVTSVCNNNANEQMKDHLFEQFFTIYDQS